MKCGLLGRKLGHSYSPAIHALLGDYEYSLFEREPNELDSFLRNGDWDGINITMPYKQAVIPYLDSLTPIAKELAAVNTIIRRDGKLIGANTDYWGFLSMVAQSGLSLAGKKCLVLGSGGASKVAQAVLRSKDAYVVVISRGGENNYENLSLHADAAIIVNTTPVGMYPNTGVSPVDLDLFPHLEGVLDLVYNPARTQLLMDAEKRGIVAMNGLWILISQAIYAAEWFTGERISEEKIIKIHNHLRMQMENIILIGMPGCGKSTIGRLIAEKTGKTFADSDELVEKIAQKTIPRIFAEDGEWIFRDWETKMLESIGKQSGLVIATGGGCVTQERNYPLLHQNGTIYWLQRDLKTLSTEGRPLSQNADLQQLYENRKHMYLRFADHTVVNNGSPSDNVNAILEEYL